MRGQHVNHESNSPSFEALESRVLMSAKTLDPEPSAYESASRTEAIAIETLEIAHEGLMYQKNGGQTEADAEPQDAFMYMEVGGGTGTMVEPTSLEFAQVTFHVPAQSDVEPQEPKHVAKVEVPNINITFSAADADVASADDLLQSDASATDANSRDFFNALIAETTLPAFD